MTDLPQPRELNAVLLIRGLSGAVVHQTWIVSPEQKVLLGRTVAPEEGVIAISILDPRISSQHCSIAFHDGAYRAMDLNSRNGILLNGNRISRGAAEELRDGDVLTVADLVLEVRVLRRSSVQVQESSRRASGQTVALGLNGQEGAALVLDLMPSPLALSVRRVRHAIGPADLVQEIIRSFDIILRFQTLVALSEYFARGVLDEQVQGLLTSFLQRPFSLGRWLELHGAVTRALAGCEGLVVEELGIITDGEDARRWRANAARIVELRNSLFHGDGLGPGSVESVHQALALVFNEVLARLAFWVGYRFISIEPGSWNDRAGAFLYPCRLLLGCATPHEAKVLRCTSALPSRVPMVVSRDGKRRLSLGPLQDVLPGPDRQLHWFSLSECVSERLMMATYPASFRLPSPSADDIRRLFCGQDMPSMASAEFRGDLTSL